jgi:RNA polymerase sigma-70 factor (ECF subfamily)
MTVEAGDALEQLYREAGAQLVLSAYALTGNVADAQDAVQDAFVRAFRDPEQVMRADNPLAYMRTATLNAARTRHGRMRRLGELMLRLPPPKLVLPGLGPDRVAVLTALGKLPAHQREAIWLHYFADLPIEEIATSLGVPVGTIKSRLKRGREAMLALVSDRDGEDGGARSGGGARREDLKDSLLLLFGQLTPAVRL